MDEVERIKKEKMKKMMQKSRTPIKITDSNFDEFIAEKKYAMVDCWAAWCMPCKMLSPTIEKVAQEYGDKVAIGKLNVDENNQIPSKFGIMSIPTILFFKEGELVDRITGAVPKQVLEEKLHSVME